MAPVNPHYEGDPAAIEEYKEKGKKLLKVMPSGLNIAWGRDCRYWTLPDKDKVTAELLQICWLEVTGSVDDTDPSKDCEVIYNLSLTPDAFGWGGCPVYIMVKRGKEGKFVSKKHQLTAFGESKFDISCKLVKAEDNQDRKVYFGLYEFLSGKWKGGLQIHHVIVREA